MDESFRQKREKKEISSNVSILVLMDESFRQAYIEWKYPPKGFHPCFNG